MFWIVDLIVLIIFALCIFTGYKRGLAKSLVKVLSFAIALIVAIALFKPVSNFVIEKTEFDDNIRNSITQIIADDVEENGEVKEDTNLPQSMVNFLNEKIKASTEETKQVVVNNVANEVATIAVNVCVGLGLFIGTRIILLIVCGIFSIITELPILKQVDKVGGIIYGILNALVIIFVVFAIISFISPMIEQTQLITTINKSIIGSVMYNNNILLKVIL